MWSHLKQQLFQWRGVWIAAPAIAALTIALRCAGLLQMLELAAFDRFFLQRPIEPPDDRIVIVDITEKDVRKTRRWPMTDALLTQLLKNIKAQQPRVIGLDLYRDLQVDPGYRDLAKLFETTPNLIGIRKVTGDPEIEAVPPPPALKYPQQVGTNDLPLDSDGKVRRFYLSLPIAKEQALYKNETALDGLGVKLALRYLAEEGINAESLDASKKHYKLGQAVLVPFQSSDGGYVGAEDRGYQMLLNYRGPHGSFPTISMTDVLENRIPPQLMRDRIVIIGASAVSLNDRFYTPYSNRLLVNPERMPGVEIHANVTSHLLSAAISGRAQIQTWAEPLEWVWIFAWSVLGATLTWTQRQAGAKGKASPLLAGSLAIAAASLTGGCYLAFLGGWWIPLVPPLLAMSGSALAITAYIARSAGEIRKTFGRYLTDEVVANLLETPAGLKLGGERKKVTILMSDLRGFSSVSERLPPESVIHFLNIYLGAMAEIISQYQGTIDEFIGDAILVIFGAPNQRDDDAQRAVACAVAMQRGMEAVNQQIAYMNMPAKLEMGIAINTGEVVVGNIGSEKRAKYGIVGSNVNLTGRIESYTVGGQVLISEYTYQEAAGAFKVKGEMQVKPKGIKHPITIYEIAGVAGKYNLDLPAEKENMLALKEPIPVKYNLLEGKHIVGEAIAGSVVSLSEIGAEICSAEKIAPLSNIKILMMPKDEINLSPELYAKVTAKVAETENGFFIRFTAVPPDVEALIAREMEENRNYQ